MTITKSRVKIIERIIARDFEQADRVISKAHTNSIANEILDALDKLAEDNETATRTTMTPTFCARCGQDITNESEPHTQEKCRYGGVRLNERGWKRDHH